MPWVRAVHGPGKPSGRGSKRMASTTTSTENAKNGEVFRLFAFTHSNLPRKLKNKKLEKVTEVKIFDLELTRRIKSRCKEILHRAESDHQLNAISPTSVYISTTLGEVSETLCWLNTCCNSQCKRGKQCSIFIQMTEEMQPGASIMRNKLFWLTTFPTKLLVQL